MLTRPDRRADGWILLAVVAGTAFALARSWSYFALPPLEYEDGKYIYEYFYEQREPSQILRFKAGFLPLLPNLLGWLSVRLDPRWAPYLLTWGPLLLAIFTFTRAARPPATFLMRDASMRRLFVLAALVAPIGQIHLLGSTDYCIHNCGFLLAMLVCLWPARLSVVAWLLINLLVWTHPLTSLAAPFLVWDAWRRPHRRPWWRVLTAVNCVLHALFGGEADLAATMSGAVSGLAHLPRFVAQTVAWFTLGPGPTEWLKAHAPWALLAWAALVLCVPAVAALRRRAMREPMLRLIVLVGVWELVTVAIRGVNNTIDTGQFRFWYPPGLLIWLAVLGSAGQLLPRRARAPVAIAAAVWFLAMNLGPIEWYRSRHPDNGPMVRALMQRIHEHETRTGTWRGFHGSAPKIDDWPMVIDTR